MKEHPILEVGCHFDSNRGIYIGQAVQELAVEYGWTEKPVMSPDDMEYHDAWSEAETYLEQFLPPYCYLGSNDSGDWGVWPNVDDEEVLRVEDLSQVHLLFKGNLFIVNDHGNVTCAFVEKQTIGTTHWSVV